MAGTTGNNDAPHTAVHLGPAPDELAEVPDGWVPGVRWREPDEAGGLLALDFPDTTVLIGEADALALARAIFQLSQDSDNRP